MMNFKNFLTSVIIVAICGSLYFSIYGLLLLDKRIEALELQQVQELQQQEQVDVFQDYEAYEVELNTMAKEPRGE